MCLFVLYSRVSLSSCPFLDILYCLPRAVGVPLESALNLVSRMSPCGLMILTLAVLGVMITCSICYDRAEIEIFIEVRITYLSQHNQLPSVLLWLWRLSDLLLFFKDKVSLVILCQRTLF